MNPTSNISFLVVIVASSIFLAKVESFSIGRIRNPQRSSFATPILSTSTIATTRNTQLQMGLFDMFLSEEEREKIRLRKEAEIAEQERLLEEMRERRTNPQKMEEYEVNVAKRRLEMKSQKRSWEKFEEKVGEGGVRVVGQEE